MEETFQHCSCEGQLVFHFVLMIYSATSNGSATDVSQPTPQYNHFSHFIIVQELNFFFSEKKIRSVHTER